jgi:hypothetical protein
VATHAGERQHVGLDAGAAGGIGGGENQDQGRSEIVAVSSHSGKRGRTILTSTALPFTIQAILAEITATHPHASPIQDLDVPDLRFHLRRRNRLPEEGIAPGTRWEDIPPTGPAQIAAPARKISK